MIPKKEGIVWGMSDRVKGQTCQHLRHTGDVLNILGQQAAKGV